MLQARLQFVRIAIICLAVVNVALLFTTAMVQSDLMLSSWWSRFILEYLDLSEENNLAAWYSSALLFVAGILAVFCFAIDNRLSTAPVLHKTSWGWILCSLVFFALSFDEMGSIHEQIGDFELVKQSGELMVGGVSPGWDLFYWSIGLVGSLIIALGFVKLRKHRYILSMFLFGVCCYLSNPIQEHYEITEYRAAADPMHWIRPTKFLILEEGSEIFGSLAFIMAMLLYITHSLKEKRSTTASTATYHPGNYLSSQLLRKIGIAFFVIIPAGYLATFGVFGNVRGSDQTGVPINWYPSMICLSLSFYFLDALVTADSKKGLEAVSYIILISGMMIFSAVIGSNLQHELTEHKKASLIIGFIFALVVVSLSFLAKELSVTVFRFRTVKSVIVICTLLMAGAMLVSREFADLGIFVSSYAILASLTARFNLQSQII